MTKHYCDICGDKLTEQEVGMRCGLEGLWDVTGFWDLCHACAGIAHKLDMARMVRDAVMAGGG